MNGNEPKQQFLRAINRRMIEMNISYYQLAKRSGVSKGNISKIFNRDANMTMETMVRLAHAVLMKVEITLEANKP